MPTKPIKPTTDESVSASASKSGSGLGSGNPADPAKKVIMLGRFRLITVLGQGAMGKVVRAEDTQLKRHVALKCLPRQKGPTTYRVEQFVREGRSAATLEHPSIVQIYEVGEASGHHYIAMELIEGGDLSSLIKACGPFDLTRACQLTAEAAEGLAYATQLGVVHRDIKPQNLMLTRSGRCKITDFGLAHMDDPTDGFALPNGAVGTPAYMAPEVIQRLPATAKSDVYSLASVLFFLLTGRPPFASKNRAELLRMQVESPVPNIAELRPDLPESLGKILTRALSKNPDERPSADTFAKQLRAHTIPVSASGSGSQIIAPSPFVSATNHPSVTPSPAKKSRTLLYGALAGGIAAALLVAATLVFISSSNHPQPASAAPPQAPQVVYVTPTPAITPQPTPAAPLVQVAAAPGAPSQAVPTPPVTPAPTAETSATPAVEAPAEGTEVRIANTAAIYAAAKANRKITAIGTVADVEIDGAEKLAIITFKDNPDLRVTYAARLYSTMGKRFSGKDGIGMANKLVRITGYLALINNKPQITLTSSTQVDSDQ
jgi:eukaryotic-like serine/threonine-protein kinase